MTSTPVVLPVLSGQQAQAWDTLMSVAGSLGEGWTLIGGQMVLLHQSERQPAAVHPSQPGQLHHQSTRLTREPDGVGLARCACSTSATNHGQRYGYSLWRRWVSVAMRMRGSAAHARIPAGDCATPTPPPLGNRCHSESAAAAWSWQPAARCSS